MSENKRRYEKISGRFIVDYLYYYILNPTCDRLKFCNCKFIELPNPKYPNLKINRATTCKFCKNNTVIVIDTYNYLYIYNSLDMKSVAIYLLTSNKINFLLPLIEEQVAPKKDCNLWE